MANIRDVAHAAGVSISTVSRILSGDTTFKTTPQTIDRVLSAARELSYEYHHVTRRQKKIHLGCIMAVTTGTYSDPFFERILAAAKEEALHLGAVVSFLKNFEDLEKPGFYEELQAAELSGILLMERVRPDAYHRISSIVPHIVYIDNAESEQYFNGVGYDHVAANWQVMNCFLEHGYRRIGIISGGSPNEPFSDSIRLVIYREALRRAGIPYDPALVKDCNWDLDLCAEQTRELLSLPEPLDAIFAGSDSLASVILGTLYSMGLRCPRDLGVIGFNNISLSAHMIPPLTTVDIPMEEIGITAVRRLLEMVQGNSGSARKILFPTTLVERDSLKEVSP